MKKSKEILHKIKTTKNRINCNNIRINFRYFIAFYL